MFAEEIANQLRDSGAKAIITLAAFHRQVAEARKSLKGEQANMPWVTIKYLVGTLNSGYGSQTCTLEITIRRKVSHVALI